MMKPSWLRRRRGGFTLVEILTATALALFMLAMMAQMFAGVSGSINEYRSTAEMQGELRATAARLQQDLSGATIRGVPPLNPEDNLGMLEYVEGPLGPIVRPEAIGTLRNWQPGQAASNTDVLVGRRTIQYLIDNYGKANVDTTQGDTDDILGLTTYSPSQPFTGRANGVITESPFAEVWYFVRGTTLYRRQLLVGPALSFATTSPGAGLAYTNSDVSVRFDRLSNRLVPNTLGDLTKRENRYAHQPGPNAWPHDVRYWGVLGLPTVSESASDTNSGYASWPFPTGNANPLISVPAGSGGLGLNASGDLDGDNTTATDKVVQLTQIEGYSARQNPLPYNEVNTTQPIGGTPPNRFSGLATINRDSISAGQDPNSSNVVSYLNKERYTEDVILTNVLAFDVRIWDPGAPIIRNTLRNTSDPTDTERPPLKPGDPGYINQINNSPTVVGYGAFVDLNYLGILGMSSLNHDPNTGEFPLNYTAPATAPDAWFSGPGNHFSGLVGSLTTSSSTSPNPLAPSVYDTYSTHYETDGIDQDDDGQTDEYATGFVRTNNQPETSAPYPYPIRAIQVMIRVFDPDTQQVRETVVEQHFSTN
jgi:type II secretory pathway pseudopilin PulG